MAFSMEEQAIYARLCFDQNASFSFRIQLMDANRVLQPRCRPALRAGNPWTQQRCHNGNLHGGHGQAKKAGVEQIQLPKQTIISQYTYIMRFFGFL